MGIFKWLPLGRVPEISAKHLKAIIEDVQILDVRTAL